MRHLNTAPGDFTEVLYLESAFGAPTRTLSRKKDVLSQSSSRQLMLKSSHSRVWAVQMLTGTRPQHGTVLAGLGTGSPTVNLSGFLQGQKA